MMCGFAVLLLVTALYVYHPTFLTFLDNKTYDIQLEGIHTEETSGLPVIVDIDEKSLAEFGQWPWPRSLIAILLQKISEFDAQSIAIDILFAEPDRISGVNVKPGVLKNKERKAFEALQEEGLNNDTILAEVLSSGPFILGYEFLFSIKGHEGEKCLIHPLDIASITSGPTENGFNTLFSPSDLVCNLKSLTNAVTHSGFVNIAADVDGITRRAPIIMEYEDEFYPSLALASLLHAWKTKQGVIKALPVGVESLRVKETVIPLDQKGNILIHFRGSQRTFEYISASDLLNNLVPDVRLRDKIVFVGTTSPSLKEYVSTPVDAFFPGVEVHATIVDNIIKKDFLWRPPYVSGLELAGVVLSGFVFTILLVFARAGIGLLVFIVSIFAVWFGSELMLQNEGILISPVVPLISIVSHFSILNLLKYWNEEIQVKKRTRELLSLQDFMMQSLASLAETRDRETGGHIFRTQHYIQTLCEHLARHNKSYKFLSNEVVEVLTKLAPIHDIGKVGVRDNVLLKDGKLSDAEFDEIKKHTVYGRDAIQNAERRADVGNNAFIQVAKEMAYTHHERWDGSGYPEGLKGTQIPFVGRVMALADVYDSLTSKRVYRTPVSHQKAVEIILEEKGKQFDPDLVEAFLHIEDQWRRIALEFADSQEEQNLPPNREI